jgi:hypothetical protein
MRIEDNVGVFTISEVSDETNETYIGEFKVKLILSPLDLLAIDRDYRELLGPVNPIMASSDANNIAFALSQLRHRILSYPSFWKGNSYDGGHLPNNVLYAILDASIEVQDKFKKARQDEMAKIQAKLTKQVKSGKIKKKAQEESELTENEEE